MRIYLRLSTALLALLFCATADTPNDPGASPFVRLTFAVQEAVRTYPPPSELAPYLSDTSNAVARLSGLYQRNTKQTSGLPRVYLVSLGADSSALESLKKLANDRERIGAVSNVRDDLWVKAEYASGPASNGGTFPAVIRVTVHTVRDGKEVGGLWVRCNPFLDGVNNDPKFIFNSATSPTTSQLPPGELVMWVESSGGQVLTQRPIVEGANGLDQDTINLALP